MAIIDRFNSLSLPELYATFERTGLIRRVLELARDEDLGQEDASTPSSGRVNRAGSGDITSDCCIDPAKNAVGHVVARSGGVIAGLAAVPELVRIFAPACVVEIVHPDGSNVPPMTTIATVRGPLDEMLSLERTLLNLVGRLSGIATRTANFAKAIEQGSRSRLYDTRKTTPGLRVLEKYAVRCGGGFCHRIGLFDAVLIKDNHISGVSAQALPEFVHKAAAKARAGTPSPSFIQVEADTLEQFEALLALEPGVIDIVLLDNMTCEQMTHASKRRDAVNPVLQLEASGGVNIDTITPISRTGVDRISVGGLTHSATVLDVAMDVEA